ncbi:MAG: xanthan lyase [Salinivirgaceae bacterium]|jgi:hypothetical protein|nr:xanthan lyase [Salinivirgaceae bacterium]
MKRTIMTFAKLSSIPLLLLALIIKAPIYGQTTDTPTIQNIEILQKTLADFINSPTFAEHTGHYKKDSTKIDSIDINATKRSINIYFDKTFAYSPIRENTIHLLNNQLKGLLVIELSQYNIQFFCDKKNINEFIPNYYMTEKINLDKTRIIGKIDRKSKPLVQNISNVTNGKTNLWNTNIALWNSHGWYYEPSLNRWEWQRARLFNTVEDLYPTVYILHYLMPMLENAGANVFLPRERHWQTNEVIVDKDSNSQGSIFKTYSDFSTIDTGFRFKKILTGNENPFMLGTSLAFKANKKNKTLCEWIPEIREAGEYPVYISYSSSIKNTDVAKYKVYHTGGSTEFAVNQTISGGTWVYLGNFNFKKGSNPDIGKVVLVNPSKNSNTFINADAVRFGSGMGTISRNGLTSQRPRYQEAARYYLQYAGFPDSTVWKQNDNNDYADDRHARGSWVNYMMGAPSGSVKNKVSKGMGVPIDFTLAFHTDAGMANGDTIIGTLGIYSTKIDSNIYPNGLSKMTSRDLVDIIQTQIVNDIRIKYNSDWVRRDMWDKAYTEAVRPNTPTMMLELLSHQNFNDMRLGKEPSFQFDVSRAVYKGMLKFLYTLYDIPYIVQPLPVAYFQTELINKNKVVLKWEHTIDTLEPTATPTHYMVYKRTNSSGYDNGTLVKNNEFTLSIDKDVIYSFKITAVNEGGESFPSDELSVGISKKTKGTVVVLNAFDRLGGSAFFNDKNTAGFLSQQDAGVPYMYDISTTGDQYDFDKKSPWLDDDSPGFGASYADLEEKIIPGNTFNFSYTHGKSILKAGYSFTSVSDESVESGKFNINNYNLLDFLAGEEKTTYLPNNDSVAHYQIFTKSMVAALQNYTEKGGSIFISGAHIASDIQLNNQNKEIEDLLKYKWRTSNASRTGECYFMDSSFNKQNTPLKFNTGYNSTIYTVEGADALEPAINDCKTLLRYSENNMNAGIIYKGKYNVVALGFPFETIISDAERDSIMRNILNFLNK